MASQHYLTACKCSEVLLPALRYYIRPEEEKAPLATGEDGTRASHLRGLTIEELFSGKQSCSRSQRIYPKILNAKQKASVSPNLLVVASAGSSREQCKILESFLTV